MNLQDSFLNQVRIQKIPLSVFLTGGHQIKGILTGFDSFILLLDSGGKQNLLYKHAVATIMPLKPVVFTKSAGTNPDEKALPNPPEEPEEKDE